MLKEGTFVKKKFVSLIICSILGWLVSILGGMADSIIAGLYLDSEAVSAVELISPLESVLYFFVLLISTGFPLMYSTVMGAFDVERSQKIAGMSVIISIVLGVLLSIVMVVFKDSILAFYGCTGQLYEYASQYYDPLIFMVLIEPLMWTLYKLVNCDGDDKLALINDIAMTVSNVVFSLLLVKSKGIAGLAIGTTLSYVLGLLITLPHFLKKTNSIHFKLYFNLKDLLEALNLSSSTALATLYAGIVDLIFNKIIISRFGQDMIPAYAVVNVALSFGSFLMCTMDAGQIFTTIAYGEENYFAIRRTMKFVHRSMLIIGIVFLALMIYIAPFWAGIYGITDPVVEQAATFAGRVVPIGYIFTTLVYNYLEFYPSVGRSLEGNIISSSYLLIAPFVLSLPMGLLGSFNTMSVGFALTPVFAVAVLLIYCKIKGNTKKLPYLLPDDDKINFHADLQLTDDSIVELRDKAAKWLEEHRVDHKTILEIQLIIEETLIHIKNRNKKKVYCECDLLLSDDRVCMITKDNGVVFNMLKEADDSLDLGCYVAARAMEQAKEKSYTTTTSFNRNSYIWDRVHADAKA